MKLAMTLLIAACLHVSATTHGQKVTFSGSNVGLQTIFNAIQEQTGYGVFIEDGLLKQTKKVTVELKDASIEETLRACFGSQPIALDFWIAGRSIVVKKRIVVKEKEEKSVLISDLSLQAFIDIHGHITDSLGNPLAGASVTVKGNKQMGASTNNKGDFFLKGMQDENAILLISFTGFSTQQIKIKGRNSINIILFPSQTRLDEVQVIAYGTTTQRYNVGSITKVSSDEIDAQPVSNPLATLEGRVPGLVVTQSSGIPGSSFTVQIRGQNSINPTPGSLNPYDQPFFIIDGVPFAPQNSNVNQFNSIMAPPGPINNNAYGGVSPFNSINPSDIESIEVLRDADATAIYGSRGANGVILITTKKGKIGKTKFGINAYTGVSQVNRTMKMMNTSEYRMMRQEALNNDMVAPTLSFGPGYAPDLLVFDSTRNIDWVKYFLGRSASSKAINATLTGGSENTQFLLLSDFNYNSYIFPGNFGDYRGSFNSNIHHNSMDKRFMVDFSANYSYDQNNSSGNANSLLAFTLPPNYPALQNSDGSLNWYYKGVNLFLNPLGYLNQKYNLKNYNLITHFQIEYKFLHDFTLRSNFGYNTFTNYENSQIPQESNNPQFNPIASSSFGTNVYSTWIIEPQIEFSKIIGKGKLNILAGTTFQSNSNTATNIYAYNYPNDGLLGSISGAANTTSSDKFSHYKYSAFFGRINYVFNHKYIMNLTGRRDGSSRFGPGEQFGNFGSAGIGWLFSEESLIKRLFKFISYGKLRATYGITGSDAIGDYGYLARWGTTVSNGGTTFQGTNGYVPLNLFNSKYSWAVNRKKEIGLEFGFLNDRILIQSTWFCNRTNNQLVSYTLPSQTGFSGVTENFPALIQNTGGEFSINTINIKGKGFNWSTSFNLSIPKNKLVSFPGFSTSSYIYTYILGQSVNVLNKFIYSGVDPSTGIYEFKTKSGLTSTPNNPTDFQVIGNLDPKAYGGLNNSLSYKNFQLNIFLEFKKQLGPNYLQQVYQNATPGYYYVNMPVSFLSRWRKAGDNTNIEKFTAQEYQTAGTTAQSFTYSNAAYSDATYIRFKNISFSYSLGKKALNKLKMNECKFYINAQNIFTITKYRGNDPETMSFYGIPPLKTLVIGLQLNL